ncbi:hypothetical protein Z046_31245 [Pseudomonas aeruginosa VRFPA09]|nr:hypothetical protein Z046_31245 [Pseudomonas aeruginosa VRFPA09]
MQVLVDQPVGGAAIRLGTVAQRQQGTDFLLGHVQRAAVTDERQALDMRQGVLPIVAFATRGLGQQAFALVVTDGLHRATGSLRQLTDLHANPPPIADAATRIGSTALLCHRHRPDLEIAVVLRVIGGIASAIIIPTTFALVAEVVAPQRQAGAMGQVIRTAESVVFTC